MDFVRKFYQWGIYGNRWLWFHSSAGMLGFGLAYRLGFVFWLAVMCVAMAAIGWEVIEYFIECGGDSEKIIEIYGSIERWAYDSLGDVIMPMGIGSLLWLILGGS